MGNGGWTCQAASAAHITVASCSSLVATRWVPPWQRNRRSRLDAHDVKADLTEVLIPADRLQARVAELAAEIDAERYRNLPFIGTLAPHVYGGELPGSEPAAGAQGNTIPDGKR